ncbi:redoxin domain-containing protein [Nonomuraea pusilla]|uniref:TlpA family protein disulfide reductase n=1 Tax=Nonomuraea pusilla TaxID=46177 RepID=UPI00331DE47F
MRAARRLGWIGTALLVPGLAVVLAHGLRTGEEAASVAVARRPAPALEGTTLDGRRVSLAALRGHVVVVNVWASWCGPCREEFPYLVETAPRLAARGARVLGLDVRDGPEPARRFVEEFGAQDLPHLSDPDGRLALDLGAFGVPETFLIDRDGTIVQHLLGPMTPQWVERHVLPLLDPR